MKSTKPGLNQWLTNAAAQRHRKHVNRQRKTLVNNGRMTVLLDKQALINFSSNDYLGLASEPALAEAVADGARTFGVGSGASALVTGYRDVHRALEEELAEFLQRDRVLLCSSGYQANLATLSSLASHGNTIIQDRLCHASLIDGAKLSGARLKRYPHADLEAAERQLQSRPSGNSLLVTDGIFSMDGDCAPLRGLADMCKANEAWLVVDDAHGIGVTGPDGRGSAAEAGLGQEELPVLLGTLGKAFGCSGAFIAGSEALIEHIVNAGRTYLFTTAISPAITAAARAALGMVRSDQWRRDQLQENIGRFKQGAADIGLNLIESDSPIQPLLVGDASDAVRISNALQDKGLLVTAIRPPTVPVGSSRLRLTLSAAHDSGQIAQLLEGLAECVHGR
jgi:8-amino-7-oxononanoate synthase